MSEIETYLDSNAAVITLNDAQQGNRLNSKILGELFAAFENAFDNSDIRAVLLRASGDIFCSGMDLREFQAVKNNPEILERSVSLYVELLNLVYSASKPVVCLINGDVKAGGIGLAGVCDVIVASQKSTFEFSEVFFGLIPANVMPFIYSLRVAPQKLKYLIMTAKKITAWEALQLNLVDEVFPVGELEKGLKSIMKNIFRASPDAIAEIKKISNLFFCEKPDKTKVAAKEKLLELLKKQNVADAIKAFNEGVTPEWFTKYRPENKLL